MPSQYVPDGGRKIELLVIPVGSGFSSVTPVVMFTGIAFGGFVVNPRTKPVIGWSYWMAYAARTEVFPLLNGSHANPTRGPRFLLFW